MSTPFDVIKDTLSAEIPRPTERVSLELEAEPQQEQGQGYVLSPELSTAVNVALALNQPLLVTGEPGSGKTTLAWAVAQQLNTEVYPFHCKSTSLARDALYTCDTLRRFYDASSGSADARDPERYIRWEALGRAMRSDHSVVVLIDDIDKAPRDFANDLLHELDARELYVTETGETCRQKVGHFVLVTSNEERRLPDAFLRRCVFVNVRFPSPPRLERIVTLRCRRYAPSSSFVTTAVRRFWEIRHTEGLAKRPATSELIGWVQALCRIGIDEETLEGADASELPALESLIKLGEDRVRVGLEPERD